MASRAGAKPSIKDPVRVDPKHYRVEFENEKVRILRVKYGAKEKSVMHGHPATVAVFLGDASFRFTFPDGKVEDGKVTAGQAMYYDALEHLPENTGDKDFEVIAVELKS